MNEAKELRRFDISISLDPNPLFSVEADTSSIPAKGKHGRAPFRLEWRSERRELDEKLFRDLLMEIAKVFPDVITVQVDGALQIRSVEHKYERCRLHIKQLPRFKRKRRELLNSIHQLLDLPQNVLCSQSLVGKQFQVNADRQLKDQLEERFSDYIVLCPENEDDS
jgi:hypothetical protein